jgi:hypothetical protein
MIGSNRMESIAFFYVCLLLKQIAGFKLVSLYFEENK